MPRFCSPSSILPEYLVAVLSPKRLAHKTLEVLIEITAFGRPLLNNPSNPRLVPDPLQINRDASLPTTRQFPASDNPEDMASSWNQPWDHPSHRLRQ